MNQTKELDLKQELKRRQSQTAKILAILKEKGEINTAQLQRIGTGCSSRIHELRREGHIIAPSYEKPGMWRYVYLGLKDDVQG